MARSCSRAAPPAPPAPLTLLSLLSSTTFNTGVLHLVYARADTAASGNVRD